MTDFHATRMSILAVSRLHLINLSSIEHNSACFLLLLCTSKNGGRLCLVAACGLGCGVYSLLIIFIHHIMAVKEQ